MKRCVERLKLSGMMYGEIVNDQPDFGLNMLFVQNCLEFHQEGLPGLDVCPWIDGQDWSLCECSNSSNHRDALQSLLLQPVLDRLIGKLPCLLDVRFACPYAGGALVSEDDPALLNHKATQLASEPHSFLPQRRSVRVGQYRVSRPILDIHPAIAGPQTLQCYWEAKLVLNNLHPLPKGQELVVVKARPQVLFDVRRKWLRSPPTFTCRLDLVVFLVESFDDLATGILLD